MFVVFVDDVTYFDGFGTVPYAICESLSEAHMVCDAHPHLEIDDILDFEDLVDGERWLSSPAQGRNGTLRFRIERCPVRVAPGE